ncbi:MAG: hypothetical protein JXA68_00180 [Ignavibacteriales bacterium]|nr:hypothetical protein [Ignavibacteriales bacterium]
MNRRDFFKNLGITAGTVIIAPSVIAQLNEDTTHFPKPESPKYKQAESGYIYFEDRKIIKLGEMQFSVENPLFEITSLDNPEPSYIARKPVYRFFGTGYLEIDYSEFVKLFNSQEIFYVKLRIQNSKQTIESDVYLTNFSFINTEFNEDLKADIEFAPRGAVIINEQ